MKKIYVLLMHTNTIPSKLIKFFTRYKYSHVSISLQKDCNTMYSFGRRNLYNIFNAGFVVETSDGSFFKKFNKTLCRIYEIEVTDKQYENVKKVLEEMEANMNDYKYDFLGIIPRFFKIPVTFENKFVCSYFVADLLEKAEVCTFEKATCFVVPKSFEHVNKFHEIYNGSYLKYTARS